MSRGRSNWWIFIYDNLKIAESIEPLRNGIQQLQLSGIQRQLEHNKRTQQLLESSLPEHTT